MNRILVALAVLLPVIASPASVANQHSSDRYAMEIPYRVVTSSPNGHLNVRSGPTVRSPVVGRLKSGTSGIFLNKCARHGPWCMIDFEGIRGWINMRYASGYAE